MNRIPAIFLNGTSSSGKTTLARAFQKAMPEPTLYVSNDKFIFMAADHVLKDDAVRPKVLLPLLSAFHQSLPIIANCGFPMIIDHVIERKNWMDEIANALAGLDVYFVKVECPLEELERREIARGDRQVGFAKMQLSWVHAHCDYDATVDTFQDSVEHNVEKLKQLLASGQKPTALENYRKKLRAEQDSMDKQESNVGRNECWKINIWRLIRTTGMSVLAFMQMWLATIMISIAFSRETVRLRK